MHCFKFLSACALLGATLQAHAAFTLAGTRVIYEESAGETSVRALHASGDKPALLQAWLDDGSPEAKPGAQDLPFLLTPAVARVDPGKGQVIRILRTRDELPRDRESLLFFNVVEVPQANNAPRQDGVNYLRIAMQTRVKFFYRPQGLTTPAKQAADLLRFTLQGKESDGKLSLRIHNPTPYHVTMTKIALATEGAQVLAEYAGPAGVAPMVAPLSDLDVRLTVRAPKAAAHAKAAPAQVQYAIINDEGGINAKHKPLDGSV